MLQLGRASVYGVFGNEEALFGPEHSDVATSLSNLANVYNAQGGRSEALYLECLKMRKRLLGEEDPDMSTSFKKPVSALDE